MPTNIYHGRAGVRYLDSRGYRTPSRIDTLIHVWTDSRVVWKRRLFRDDLSRNAQESRLHKLHIF